MSATASPAMDGNRPPRRTRGVRHAICAVVVALFASSLPAASAKRGTVKIGDIVDDFSASALSRCEACAAVTHAEILYIDRVKMGKLARTGSSAVGEEDLDAKAVCEERFAGGARYGYKSIDGENRLHGPGLDSYGMFEAEVTQRGRVTKQLLDRCKALMYAWDDFSIAETYSEVVEIVEKSKDVPAQEKSNEVFMHMLKRNCVENVKNQCESIEWFKKELVDRFEKATDERTNATQELYERVTRSSDEEEEATNQTSPSRSIDIELAIEKCAATAGDTLSPLACGILLQQLMKKGEENTKLFKNFTLEAKKYENKFQSGDVADLDEEDVDQDGDVDEPLNQAMHNVSDIKAHIVLNRALGFFSSSLRLKPDSTAARHNMAFCLNEAKNHTGAKEYLMPLLDAQHSDAIDAESLGESWKLLCEIEFHSGNTTGALLACAKGIDSHPYNFHILRLAAQIHMVQFFEGLREVRELDENVEDFKDRQLSLLSHLRDAKSLFTSAILMNPVKNEIAQLGMVLYFEQAAEAAALHQLTTGQLQVLESSRYRCAVQGNEVDGVCPDILELSGGFLAKEGFIAIANDAVHMALAMDGKRTHLWQNLAYGYMHIGKFKLAKVALDHAKSSDDSFTMPSSIESLLQRGYDFEVKLEEERVNSQWSETRRPNRAERAELEREVASKLDALRNNAYGASPSSHDEL